MKEITGSYKLTYHANGPDKPAVEIDFTPPFKRISMISGIEEAGGFTIPRPLDSDATREFLDNKCKEVDVLCPEPRTTARMLDKLVGHFLEDHITNPTFIMEHPALMSPLAK